MPRNRALPLLVVLVIPAAIAAVTWFGARLRGERQDPQRGAKVLDVRPEAVTRIVVASGGSEAVIVRQGDRWVFVSPRAAPADPAQVRALLEGLAALTRRATTAPPGGREPLASFGLEAPRARIEVTHEDGAPEPSSNGAAKAPAPSAPLPHPLPAQRGAGSARGRVERLALGIDNGPEGAMFVMPTSGEVLLVASTARSPFERAIQTLAGGPGAADAEHPVPAPPASQDGRPAPAPPEAPKAPGG